MEQIETFVPCRAVTKGPKYHFFGYYDKSPWDASGRYLLAMEVDFNNRLPRPDDVAVIWVIDLENDNRFEPVAETLAWNWQQGAMAQWVPGQESRLIIYNDRHDEGFLSVILDLESGERRVLPLPIYTLTPDGRFALSIDFARLYQARASYGYAPVGEVELLPPSKTGIYKLELATGGYEQILSYSDVLDFQSHPVMEKGQHWIDHLLVNPTSNRFLFYHRFALPNGAMYSRLLTSDLQGEALHCLLTGSASHNCWRNERQILVWARRRSFFTQARMRKLLSLKSLRWLLEWLHSQQDNWVRQSVIGDSFLLFNDLNNQVETVGTGILTEDSHPTYSPDGRWLLLDTYPDTNDYRHLLLYDCQSQKRIQLGRFYSPPEISGGIRCDLHPRWNRDGKQVCIDSAHDGFRQMYILDVSAICN